MWRRWYETCCWLAALSRTSEGEHPLPPGCLAAPRGSVRQACAGPARMRIPVELTAEALWADPPNSERRARADYQDRRIPLARKPAPRVSQLGSGRGVAI